MGADYVAAVLVRYGLLLAAAGIARMWVLPMEWETPTGVAVLLYGLVLLHAQPAARYARHAPRPWFGWTPLLAFGAHALGATAFEVLIPGMEPRFRQPPVEDGMSFVVPWVHDPSIVEMAYPIVLYALASAVLAVLAGAIARAAWGAVPPEQQRFRIRGRTEAPASHPA